jgi:hypothetical protein
MVFGILYFYKKSTFMETLVIRAEGEHLAENKSYLNKLNIPFTVGEAEPPYNPEFVEKIRKSEDEYKKGKYTRANTAEELKTLFQGE